MEILTRGYIFLTHRANSTLLFGNNFVNKPKQILHKHNIGSSKFFLSVSTTRIMGRLRRSRVHNARRDVHRAARTRV